MKDTLTVSELIDQLKKFNSEDEVVLYSVGFTGQDSFEIELNLEAETVDKFEDRVRISFI